MQYRMPKVGSIPKMMACSPEITSTKTLKRSWRKRSGSWMNEEEIDRNMDFISEPELRLIKSKFIGLWLETPFSLAHEKPRFSFN
jgi:hypothetical protein